MLVSTTAMAQDESATQNPPEADTQPERTVYRKKTVIDFSEVTIEGELSKPEGSYLLSRKPTKFRSLLKARTDFFPELKASLDALL